MEVKTHNQRESLIKDLRELKPIHFLFLAVAGVINAFGVTLFLFPVKLYDSGISGLSMLLDQMTPPHLHSLSFC